MKRKTELAKKKELTLQNLNKTFAFQIGAVPGKSLEQVFRKSARLQSLRDKTNECRMYMFGTE